MRLTNEWINGDCLKELKKMSDESVDLVIISPPYHNLRVYSNDPSDLSNCESYEEYYYLLGLVIAECQRVLKKGGKFVMQFEDYNYTLGRDNKMGQECLVGDINKIMLDKLAVNFGNLMENVVAQILTANGHSLYFYSNPDRTDSSSRMEIDFLIAKNTITNKHNILPIEIKTGKNYTLSSLRKFRDKFRDQIGVPYVFHEGEYKEEDGIVFLPLFMVICL